MSRSPLHELPLLNLPQSNNDPSTKALVQQSFCRTVPARQLPYQCTYGVHAAYAYGFIHTRMHVH